MKNYCKQEKISPTLEDDEIKRLYKSVKNVVSIEEADRLIKEIPLATNSTPEERAEWVDYLSQLLENRFDQKTIKLIRQGCFCNENEILVETASQLKKLYVTLGKDLQKFVAALNEDGAGWYFEDGFLYTKYFSCPCPMLEKSKQSSSLTWCQCTAGYNKKLFELVFELPVEADIIHSLRQGFDECLIKITLPLKLYE